MKEVTRDYSGRSYLIAECGINHNGSLDTAKEMIERAKKLGFDAVKFQKRTIDIVYSKEELAKERESPFGHTNGDLKRGLEFTYDQYLYEIIQYALEYGLEIGISPWDVQSAKECAKLPFDFLKIASPMITDMDLIDACAPKDLILSTGMSQMCDVCQAICNPDTMHLVKGVLACTSTYPTADTELHLSRIPFLMEHFPHHAIGFSSHHTNAETLVYARLAGAKIIECHVTLDRNMFGSDQKASLALGFDLEWAISRIRKIESEMLGKPEIEILDSEKPILAKLRRVGGEKNGNVPM